MTIIFATQDQSFMALDGDRLLFAPRPMKDSSELLLASKAKELGKEGVIVPIAELTDVQFHDDKSQALYVAGKRLNLFTAKLTHREDWQTFKDEIQSKRKMDAGSKRAGLLAAANKAFLFTLIVVLLTLCGAAAGFQADGGPIDGGSGRRAAQKQALAALIEAVGPWGILGIGTVLTAIGLWRIRVRLQHAHTIHTLKPA